MGEGSWGYGAVEDEAEGGAATQAKANATTEEVVGEKGLGGRA